MSVVLRSVGAGVLGTLLPPSCLTCDAAVGDQGQFCAACFRRTSFIGAPFCQRCGLPFGAEWAADGVALCTGCVARPPPFRRTRAALRYDAQSKLLLLPFKHADRPELAAPLAAFMARAGALLLREAEALVPVPLHRARLRARRYNQAALLARSLARRSGRALLVDALERPGRTPSLDHRGAAERDALVAGAFRVTQRHRAALRGLRVLLVDDVMTSGATARACAHALLQAGCASVDVLVAARVPDPRQD